MGTRSALVRNPSGHTPDARRARLSLDTFEAFFAGRGIAVHLRQSR
ncbi:hypothetical protein [Nonomuraea sp. NPDC049400]